MPDRRRTSISSVMTAKKSGASLDQRRKYDEAFKATARELGINPKLLYRWQQAQVAVEVGSPAGARGWRNFGSGAQGTRTPGRTLHKFPGQWRVRCPRHSHTRSFAYPFFP